MEAGDAGSSASRGKRRGLGVGPSTTPFYVGVCRRLKSDKATAQVKVVMLTALAQELDEEKARAAGADYYFSKPFSPTALLDKVEELLQQE